MSKIKPLTFSSSPPKPKPNISLKELLAKRKQEQREIVPVSIPAIPDSKPEIETKESTDIKARLAAIREGTADKPVVVAEDPGSPEGDSTAILAISTGMHGETISYNTRQQEFVDIAGSSKPCVLIGAAGTGKTTCSQGAISALINSGDVPILQADSHRYLRSGTPGILIIAFTRRAVNNSKRVQSEDFKNNCITAHKLLEYQPEYYEVLDPETHETKRTMKFLPTRNATNPLPNTIHTIIVEEASMLSKELFLEISEACAHKVQWIFIGDIQQLPPVFGSAILGFKMLELPVIELNHVYRQALESPIIRLAHRILSGKPIPIEEFSDWNYPNQLTIKPWKKKLSTDHAAMTLTAFFKAAIDSGEYNPDTDMILIPFNVGCGTVEVNNQIANHLARKRDAVTYEVMAGFTKHYYSVGDKVLYDKEDAEIVAIETNAVYAGTRVQKESKYLDYWGHNKNAANEIDYGKQEDVENVDLLLDSIASTDEEERTTQASHTITLRLLDADREISVSKAAEINSMVHSYALTVHKSQGSEWTKVFLCLHTSHNTMLQRELLYTAVTRAREQLCIICEPESLSKGIISQKVKGDTLEEKAEHFKGKL